MSTEPDRVETQIEVPVPPGYKEGARLDVYLTGCIQNASRSKVQQGGDQIVCTVMKPPPIDIVPEDIPLSIVYEDEALLVVDKAAGMVVHPAYGNRNGTLVNALLHHLGSDAIDMDEEDPYDELDLSSINATPSFPGDPSVRPGIVHRLDKGTSGLLVVAKTDRDHSFLARQFHDHSIERMYRAILWGVIEEEEGTIDQPLGRSTGDRKKMAVIKNGKRAVTHYKVVERLSHTSMCEFRLETGRTHQIRVHSAHISRPLLGDTTYGGDRIRSGPDTRSRNQFFQNLFSVMPRQALHAAVLGFVHPRTEEFVRFESDLPEDIEYVATRLRQVEP